MDDSVDRSNVTPTKEAPQVVRRALVMAATVCRAAIDEGAGQPDAQNLHASILEWLTKANLWDSTEPDEARMLRESLGTLQDGDVIRYTWRVEGLAILVWALGWGEFPRHDVKVDPYATADAAGLLRDDAADLVQTSILRSDSDVAACRELLYAVHSRLRDFLRHRQSTNFRGWVEKAWLHDLGVDESLLFAGNDLAIDEEALSAVPLDRIEECSHITHERHRAVIWLSGRDESYNDTAVDT